MLFTIQSGLKLKGKGALVTFMFKEDLKKNHFDLSAHYKRKIGEIISAQEFAADVNELFLTPQSFLGDRVLLLVGLGKQEDYSLEVYMSALGTAVKYLQKKKISDYTLLFPAYACDALGEEKFIKQAVVKVHAASYHFTDYLTDKSAFLPQPKNVALSCAASINMKNVGRLVREGEAVGKAVNFTRRLGNLPPLEMTPGYLADRAQELGKKYKKLKVKILGEKEIKEQGMGGLHAVSLGSDLEPKFIVLEYFNNPQSKDVYAIAGKAITFDSGGISIKPSDKMDEMKFDMLGGGAVMGAFQAVCQLAPKINVVGLIPAAENLPGHKAYRPGDIITARNGKTIEVLNTDAEGRLILADALSYAQDYKPKMAVDLATLTGACVVALGENYAGLFTRDKDLQGMIELAAGKTGDRVWPMPLDNDFKKMMKSTIADVKNISASRYGGASTGAAFLEYFTSYPWAHLDIAGVAWAGDKADRHEGATGYGVQLLVELINQWSN